MILFTRNSLFSNGNIERIALVYLRLIHCWRMKFERIVPVCMWESTTHCCPRWPETLLVFTCIKRECPAQARRGGGCRGFKWLVHNDIVQKEKLNSSYGLHFFTLPYELLPFSLSFLIGVITFCFLYMIVAGIYKLFWVFLRWRSLLARKCELEVLVLLLSSISDI